MANLTDLLIRRPSETPLPTLRFARVPARARRFTTLAVALAVGAGVLAMHVAGVGHATAMPMARASMEAVEHVAGGSIDGASHLAGPAASLVSDAGALCVAIVTIGVSLLVLALGDRRRSGNPLRSNSTRPVDPMIHRSRAGPAPPSIRISLRG